MRRALSWFFGPTQPATKRERWLLVLLAFVGLALIVLSGLHGLSNAIGVGLFGGCSGGAIANRSFRRPRNQS